MSLPETEIVQQTDTPFWDAPLDQKPYWMQVVLPAQAEQWDDLLTIAKAWLKQNPKDAEAYYYFALAEQGLGKLTEAKIKFKRIVFKGFLWYVSIILLITKRRLCLRYGEPKK